MKEIRKYLRNILLCCLVAFLLSGFLLEVSADDRNDKSTLTAAVLGDFPPFYLLDENGKPAGFAIDLFNNIAPKAGFSIKYLVVENWAAAMEALRSGKVDLIPGIGISPDRVDEFVFSEEIETIPVSIFVRKKNYSINNVNELAGHKVGVIAQSAAQTSLAGRTDLNLVLFPNIDEALLNLLAGDVDAFVFPEPVLLKKARLVGVDDKIKVVGKPLMELKRGFMLRKGDMALLNTLNSVIDAFVHSDEYLKTYVKWYGRPQSFWNNERIFWSMACLLVVAVILVMSWHNFSISRVNTELLASIGNRKKIEAALRESEALYRSLIENIDMGITYIDADHTVILANSGQGRLLNKNPQEFIGKKCFREFEKKESICGHCPGVRAMQSGKIEEVVTKAVLDDGSLLTVRIKAFPIISDENGTRGFIEVVEDISERVEIEKALHESEALLKSIFRSAPVGIGLVKDRVFAWTNHKITQMTGYEDEELLGKSARLLYPGEGEFERVGREKYEQIQKFGTGSVETKWLRKDGTIIDVLLSSAPIDLNDLAVGVTFSALDITDRKQTENELAAEKESLAVTLRSIGDGVITTDITGRIVLINKVAEKLTGWSHNEACGRPLTEVFRIINEKNRQPAENPVKKVLETGRIIGLANHTALIAKDGVERSIADSGAPIRDNDSNIVGVVLVFRDVTERLRMEADLLKVKKLESVGVLAGGIAHDFNNILTAILGNLNLASYSVEPHTELHTLLAEAEKASIRARDLTKQLLTFAKGGEPVKETASLTEVIKESADFILHGEKVGCRYDFPEDLWLVEVDKGQVSQVIQNLIINAVHAMPEGGVIKIACENVDASEPHRQRLPFFSGRYVKISITDSGVGIPAKIIDKIFDPYFTTKQEGSGLGLAITHAIIAKHGGHIFVDSKQGVGSTFTIYLPASKASELAESHEEKGVGKACAHRILVMDDEEMVLKIADKMLTLLGHEVVVSRDGEEAVARYAEQLNAGNPFDVVIMDLTIPGGMGGTEAVKKILKVDAGAKVVVASGYSTDSIMANFEEHGFRAALNKPFRMQELINILEKLMG